MAGVHSAAMCRNRLASRGQGKRDFSTTNIPISCPGFEANKDDGGGGHVRISIGGDPQVSRAPAAAEVAECCMCLDSYEEGVEVKELPCTHYFHVKCIDRWLKINGLVPFARRQLVRQVEHLQRHLQGNRFSR